MQQIKSLASQISVNSALNPILWLTVVSLAPLTMSFYLTDMLIKMIFITIGVLPWVAAVGGFLYLLFRNPAYLRSERYQLMTQILGDKDHPILPSNGKEIAMELMKNPLMIENSKQKSNNE